VAAGNSVLSDPFGVDACRSRSICPGKTTMGSAEIRDIATTLAPEAA